MCIGESHSLTGEAIASRRLKVRGSVTTQVPIPKVVGHDKHDVESLRAKGLRCEECGTEDEAKAEAIHVFLQVDWTAG